MKKLILFLLILSSALAFTQTTTVTGTIQFPDGQVFANGTVQADFTPSSGNISVFTYKLNGAAFPYNVAGTMNGSGTFSITLTDDHKVTPLGGQWKFTVCSNTSIPCSSSIQDVFGPSIDLSGPINAAILVASGNSLNLPRFWNDTEASLNLIGGVTYFNLNTNTIRFFNGTIWTNVGGTSSPLTTKGDLYTFSTVNTRLPVGSDGSCLLAASGQTTGLQWGTCGSGSLPTGAVGQTIASQGVGNVSILRPTPYWDIRDWAQCNTPVGTATGTNVTTGVRAMLAAIGTNPAKVYVRGFNNPSDTCLVSSFRQPSNVTFDYSGGGAFTLLVDHTAPGGGGVVDHSGDGSTPGQSNPAASPSATCTMTLNNTTAGNAIWVAVGPYNTFGSTRISSITDSVGNFYLQQQATTLGFPGFVAGYIAGSIIGGTTVITVNLSGTIAKNACMALELSGLGPSPKADGQGAFTFGSTTPFNPGTATFLANDFVIVYSEDPNDAQTCTAGAGYTQPPGLAGNVSGLNGASVCQEYNVNGTGGATTGTQNFNNSPVLSSYMSAIIGLRPGSATLAAQGGIIDPDLHQIFYQATGTNGTVDFTGNLALTEINPEWWGAGANVSATINLAALQASEYGAFGCGNTTCRINGSGFGIYNKQWNLNANYSINGELQLYHLIGSQGARWHIKCNNNGGITQTANNARIFDMQSTAYGNIDDCVFIEAGTTTGALLDIDYDGTHGVDLRPQFLDFNHITLSGNSNAAIGLFAAKSGGGAQYSNVYCYDCEFANFTSACYKIGTATSLAQNALSIGISGDMQGCTNNGIENHGGGWVSFSGDGNNTSSMENGYATQTGYDMYCDATQGPCIMKHYRSESRKMAAGITLELEDDLLIDQASFPNPGTGFPVNTVMRGGPVAGDGAHYQVTVDTSPIIGVGLPTAPINASGGSATTLVDTNETINGTVTIGTFNAISPETVTQATTGASGTIVVNPSSIGTITGSVTSGTFQFNEIIKQSVTNVTATEQAPSPTGSASLFANNFSGTADNTHTWVGQTSGAVYTPSAAPTFSASIMTITAHTGSPDNTHNWVGGTTGAVFVPTTVPTGTNWTVNAFVGLFLANYGQTIGSGINKNALCYGVITANTANIITVVAGWKTQYPLIQCPGPDSTSLFATEPQWNHGTVVAGGVTMVYMNEDVIGTCAGCVGFTGTIKNVTAPGGQIHIWTNGSQAQSTISRLNVTRPDWLNTIGGVPQGCCINDLDWNVRVELSGGTQPISWAMPTNLPNLGLLTPIQQYLGTKVLIWDTGGINSGNSASPTWIGGRSDPNGGNVASRNILEYGGMLGRAAPVPAASNNFNLLNVAGTDSDITGGPSTGNALGGAINWWITPAGGSGSTVNSGTKVGRVNNLGQIESLLSTGTAPYVATSTTPVTNLTTVPTTYNAAGTQQVNVHIVADSSSLVSGTPSTKVITLAGAAVFTSNASYKCAVSNTTNPANSLAITYTDGSHFTITGPNTVSDSFSFNCVGN